MIWWIDTHYALHPHDYFVTTNYLFILERGKGWEKKRERNINVWLPLVCPLLGTWHATQAYALNGNPTLWFTGWQGTQSTEPHQPQPISTSLYTRGDFQTLEFTYKNSVFILTCLNFSHLQSTLHLMQYTYWDIFCTAQNSFWTCWFWCLLVFVLFFVSTPPHQQSILKTFFHQRNKQKIHSGWDKVSSEGSAMGSCHFGAKLLNIQGRCACKSPIMKQESALK